MGRPSPDLLSKDLSNQGLEGEAQSRLALPVNRQKQVPDLRDHLRLLPLYPSNQSRVHGVQECRQVLNFNEH